VKEDGEGEAYSRCGRMLHKRKGAAQGEKRSERMLEEKVETGDSGCIYNPLNRSQLSRQSEPQFRVNTIKPLRS